MRRSRLARFCLTLSATCVVWLMPGVVAAQDHSWLYAAVTDASGAPVLDLTADEFELTMGGTVLTVASATLDAAPKIALIVDNSQGMAEAQSPLRAGLMAFLETLAPEHAVGIFSIGGQIRRRVDFTTEREELIDTAGAIFVESGSGMRLLEGLMETWDRRFEDEDQWPVFMLVVSDSFDASNFASEHAYNEFARELLIREATVHAVVLVTGRGMGFQASSNLAQNTGGGFVTINTPTGLPDSLTQLAERLNAQAAQQLTRYRVVYELPDDPGTGAFTMRILRPGVSLQAFADRRLPQ